MNRFLLLAGTAVMFLGVSAGAFGAHALSSYFEKFPNLADTYETAVRYHLIHGLAIVGTAVAFAHMPTNQVRWAGNAFLVGTIIFSGSLYLLVMTRKSWLGAITPIGGVAFLAGWLLLFIAVWRS